MVSTHGETTFPCASWKIARIATTAVVVAAARRCCRRCCRRRCRCLRNQSHRHRRVVPSATAAAAAAAATRRLTSRGTSVGAVVPLLWLARPSPSVFRFVSPRVWRVCVCALVCVRYTLKYTNTREYLHTHTLSTGRLYAVQWLAFNTCIV